MTDAARAALERMNLREVAVARHYNGIAADLRMLANADLKTEVDAFLARRYELCDAFGLPAKIQNKPFAFSNGLALVPISGTLINRFGYSTGYVTGYNFIRSQLQMAQADPDVEAIVADFNTYGGEAAGCFELAEDIKAMRGRKPMHAVVDSNCYSAGYALASAFDSISCTPSGGVGSIGVVAMHVDISKMLEDFGVKVDLIYSGDHKVDGNPFEALPKEVRADVQEGVNTSRAVFVKSVADARGMPEKKVRDTEARIYRAKDALDAGFIDAIATPQQAIASLFSSTESVDLQEDHAMVQQPGGVVVAKSDAASTAPQAATEQQLAEAATAARKVERERVSAILGHDEAKGRSALAQHLAMNTEMSVDDAAAVLKVSPKEQAPAAAAAGNPFDAAMTASKHPQVGSNAGGTGPDGEESAAARILRTQEALTGAKLKAVK